MTTIPGASQYKNAAILANKKGLPAQSASLIKSFGTVDLLDLAGGNSRGIGLSSRSRAITKQFLQQSASGFNTVFSLGTSKLGSPEIIAREIQALRAKLPQGQIDPSLRGNSVDTKA
ncbi:MAG: hypothetical protein J0L77_05615 [Alphaproteobacteria bacterium]|nr:hypothetical protein [Alphaproteobacteria bacterium]